MGKGITRLRSKTEVLCQNIHCRFYLKEEGKDIIKSGKYSTGHQRYYCHHCSSYFMETKGTPLYRKHISEPEIINICKHLVEKNGVRSIERLTGHHRDTIGVLLEDMAEHALKMNNCLIKNLGFSQYECYEFWTFVKKKRKHLSEKAKLSLKLVIAGSTTA
jgi:transposase-like protein